MQTASISYTCYVLLQSENIFIYSTKALALRVTIIHNDLTEAKGAKEQKTVMKMQTLNQAQKELNKAIETMNKVKKENTVQNDWPEVKRTFSYKKDGAL